MGNKKIPSIVKEIQNFKPEAIKYGYQKAISYSQFSVFKECRYRWSKHYRENVKIYTPSIYTIFGTAMHETLQNYLDVMYNESIVKADEIDLVEYFEEALRKEYKGNFKKNKDLHFTSSEELHEFYEDGLNIIEFFKKNKTKYFSKRGWHLVGCEIPIRVIPNSKYPNVLFQGFIDVLMYHEETETFKVIDLKTSTYSWGPKKKKDQLKQLQLVFYKKYLSQMFNIPIDKIEIEFIILKRKLYESADYAIPRIQQFIPASGKVKLNKAKNEIDEFITTAFNPKGGFSELKYEPTPSKEACFYCPFKDMPEHCDVKGKTVSRATKSAKSEAKEVFKKNKKNN